MRHKQPVRILRAIAVSLAIITPATAALAWQNLDPPPQLPETEVEADPLAPDTDTSDDVPPPMNFPPSDFPQSPPGGSVLEGSIFSSPPANGYIAESTTTGSMIDVPQLQLPATVNAVPEAVIEDQQILNLTDMLRNIPGATPVGDGQLADRFYLRGFEVRSRDFRKNGFVDPTFTPRDFQNIERLEILKGPASVLYGSAAPSGTVNFITKKPIDDQFSRFDFQFGGFGMDRYTLDTNGYVNDGGTLLYRVNGAYENSDSYRDFGYTERHLLAPSLRWRLSDDTMITWEAELIENRRLGDRGFPAIGDNALALSPNVYVGEPANDFFYTEDYRTSLVLQHRFASDWTLYAGLSTLFYEFPGSQTFATGTPFGSPPPPTPTSFYRARSDFTDQENASSLIVNLAGDVWTGPFLHRLLFGTEHTYYDTNSVFTTSAFRDPMNNLLTFDVTNPVYVNPPATATSISDFPVFRQARHGYYLQDYIELNDSWQVLAGVRFDELTLTSRSTLNRVVAPGVLFPLSNNSSEQTFYRTTPRVGVVFQPVPETLSTYFNYSRSFNPPGGGAYLFTADPVLPETGESYEVGFKTWLVDNAMLHVAWYYAERQNTPFQTFDPITFQPIFFQVGQERSRGVEAELIGQITDTWSAIANYAYTDTELTDPLNPALFGQRQRNVPLNQAGLWSRHQLYNDEVQTFGVALGMVWFDKRPANLANSVTLPSYTRMDGGLYYQRGALDATVYLENLYDRHYALSSIDEFQIMPGAPFHAQAQIGVTY